MIEKTLSKEWNDKFVVNLKGKNFVTYPGLIDIATEHFGMCGSKTELTQIPTKDNGSWAIVHATVYYKCEDGEVRSYTGIGDASPLNVTPTMKEAIIRFAETRAMGRALRVLTNIGMTMLEELDGKETVAEPEVKMASEQQVLRLKNVAKELGVVLIGCEVDKLTYKEYTTIGTELNDQKKAKEAKAA